MTAAASNTVLLPEDLAEHWTVTDWSIARKDWRYHIAFATYPVPICFDIARRYDRAAAARPPRFVQMAMPMESE